MGTRTAPKRTDVRVERLEQIREGARGKKRALPLVWVLLDSSTPTAVSKVIDGSGCGGGMEQFLEAGAPQKLTAAAVQRVVRLGEGGATLVKCVLPFYPQSASSEVHEACSLAARVHEDCCSMSGG